MMDSKRPSEASHGGPGDGIAPRCHLIGGGIASLAAAVFLIRDAGISGHRISIYEQSNALGGSLDAAGSAEAGYVTRGGRMFEEHFVCTFDLLASIPAGTAVGRTIKDEIVDFNRKVVSSSHCRLVRNGRKVDKSHLGLRLRDLFDLARFMLRSERTLEGLTIEKCFAAGFFRSNFWIMWCTTFAFHPWHSAMEFRRYLRRFIHLFPGFRRLEGILRTRFNQYDALVVPIMAWLREQGVHVRPQHQVTDLDFEGRADSRRASALHVSHDDKQEVVPLSDHDRVFLTLGSMTDGSSFGSTSVPPTLQSVEASNAWQLWLRIADRESAFGNPRAFCGDPGRSKWISFTVTLHRPAFLTFMEAFTGNVTGTGGLVTFADSGWLMSIAMMHQPHFCDQPDDVSVFWGYGLFPDRPGTFVKKPMAACSGREILQELSGQLRLGDEAEQLLGDAICRPCMMPFITSQFMPRTRMDRPSVIPWPGANLAVMGQYCEIPEDVVFTVEYSVRSAMTAVYGLFDVTNTVPGVHRTDRDPLVQWRALVTLMRG